MSEFDRGIVRQPNFRYTHGIRKNLTIINLCAAPSSSIVEGLL